MIVKSLRYIEKPRKSNLKYKGKMSTFDTFTTKLVIKLPFTIVVSEFVIPWLFVSSNILNPLKGTMQRFWMPVLLV